MLTQAVVGQRLNLAIVSCCWCALAQFGRHGPSLACVGFRVACVHCRQCRGPKEKCTWGYLVVDSH